MGCCAWVDSYVSVTTCRSPTATLRTTKVGDRTKLTEIISLGDVLCFLLAVRIIRKAAEIEGGLPSWLRSQMYFYAAIDAAGESIPFFGAIWGSIYKANTRNTWLLEDYLTKKAKKGANRGGVHEGDVEMGLAGPPRQAQQPLRQPKQTHKNGRR